MARKMDKLWRGRLVGEMHLHGISRRDLSRALGYSPQYVTAVLHGRRDPAGAREEFTSAVRLLTIEKGEVFGYIAF